MTDPPRRRRPRFRPVEVLAVRRPAPRLVSVTLGGEALEGFAIAAPTQHIKMLFPAAGERTVALPGSGPDGPVWPEGVRPAVRTYTPRRFDEETGTLDVDLLVHGDGPASTWAERAEPGDRLAVAGPGGRLAMDLDDGPWLIAADESAIPAVGTLLDALPATAAVRVLVEIDSPADEMPLGGVPVAIVRWLVRDGRAPGEALRAAVHSEGVTVDTRVWVACEAAAVRRIRRDLLDGGDVSIDRLVTRGYWRVGEQNHPDHDYGDS